ncbi:MAG: peptidylprolyl isomerase, partial [Gemmataceae bacterium]
PFMRTMQRSCWAVLGLTLCGEPALAQTPQISAAPASVQTAPAAAANAVVATVNGEAIPETAVQRSLRANRVPPAKQAEVRPQIVNFLVDQALIDQYLLQQKIAVEPKEIDKVLDDIKAEAKKEKKDLAKVLQEMKLTEAELREHITADIRWGKFTDMRATDKALKDLFDGQKYLFDGSMVHARHILLTVAVGDANAEARVVAQLQAIKQEIAKQVAEGLAKLPADTDNLTREKKRQTLLEEAFSAQAKAKSACPSKDRGGDVGTFAVFDAFGHMTMAEPFSRAAFTLKPFEISQPIKTQFGYHLILVTDRKPGREVKFEAVKEMVKDHYCTSLHDSIVGEARQRSKIVINGAR